MSTRTCTTAGAGRRTAPNTGKPSPRSATSCTQKAARSCRHGTITATGTVDGRCCTGRGRSDALLPKPQAPRLRHAARRTGAAVPRGERGVRLPGVSTSTLRDPGALQGRDRRAQRRLRRTVEVRHRARVRGCLESTERKDMTRKTPTPAADNDRNRYREHALREFQAAGWLDKNGEFKDVMRDQSCLQQ